MSLIYCHDSAREISRLVAADLMPRPAKTEVNPLSSARGGLRDLHAAEGAVTTVPAARLMEHAIVELPTPLGDGGNSRLDTCATVATRLARQGTFDYDLPAPIDLMVGRQEYRCRADAPSAPRAHLCTASLPRESFLRLSRDVYIPSPELLYLQYAQRDERIHAIATFGYELTGSYCLLPQGLVSLRHWTAAHDTHDLRTLTAEDMRLAERYVPCRPRTSVEKLAAYLANVPDGTPGLRRARIALRWVRDGSRSPMESATCLHLCLSRRRGGMEVGDAQLNVRLPLDSEWQRVLGKSYVVVDVMLVGADGRIVVIEYNGAAGHFSKSQVMADNQRRHALEVAGMHVVFVTARDFRDYATWENLGEDLARRLGRRHGRLSVAGEDRRRLVHRDLCDPDFTR